MASSDCWKNGRFVVTTIWAAVRDGATATTLAPVMCGTVVTLERTAFTCWRSPALRGPVDDDATASSCEVLVFPSSGASMAAACSLGADAGRKELDCAEDSVAIWGSVDATATAMNHTATTTHRHFTTMCPSDS